MTNNNFTTNIPTVDLYHSVMHFGFIAMGEEIFKVPTPVVISVLNCTGASLAMQPEEGEFITHTLELIGEDLASQGIMFGDVMVDIFTDRAGKTEADTVDLAITEISKFILHIAHGIDFDYSYVDEDGDTIVPAGQRFH